MLRSVVKETGPRVNFPTGLIYLGMMKRDTEELWDAIAGLRGEIETMKRRRWLRRLWNWIRRDADG